MKLVLSIKSFIINYKFIIYPFFIIFSIGYFLYNTSFSFIPDILNLENYSKTYELFNLIISSLMSLIGIYITVSLVAYEFFKQKSGIDFHKSFLINLVNAYFISFTVLTIIFTFLSSLIIPVQKLNNNEISIVYYNSLLFIFIIILLFPVSFNLFSSLKPEKLAHEEIENINIETIFIKISNEDNIDKEALNFENDHLVKIECIVIALIAVSDNIKAQLIIHKTTLKLSNLIIDEQNVKNKEYITKRLVSFYIKIIDFSLLQPNNSAILNSIWKAVYNMYFILLDRKEIASHYEKFREDFFERYFKRLIENNKEEIIFEGITTIRDIIQQHIIYNMQDDDKMYDFNHYRAQFEKDFKYPKDFSDEQHNYSKHWIEIAYETMNCFSFLMEKAVKLNMPDLLNKCSGELRELCSELKRNNVGIYKRSFIYIQCSEIIFEYTYKAFKNNTFSTGSDAKNLLPVLFDHLITEEELFARTLLQKYCYLLIDLQKINKLDRWFIGGLTIGNIITLEGDLGQIVRRCTYNFNKNKLVQDCLMDCIDTYKILKENFENDEFKNYDLYILVKSRLDTTLDLMKINKIDDNKIVEKVSKLTNSFKSQKEFEKFKKQ